MSRKKVRQKAHKRVEPRSVREVTKFAYDQYPFTSIVPSKKKLDKTFQDDSDSLSPARNAAADRTLTKLTQFREVMTTRLNKLELHAEKGMTGRNYNNISQLSAEDERIAILK